MDIQTLLQSMSGRTGIYGVRTADQYQRDIVPDEADSDAWHKHMEAAALKLTFSAPNTLVDVKSIAKGEDGVNGVVMRFNAILTTSKRDRDYDILVTSGASVDPNMPLLWQHCSMQPIGKFVRTTRHSNEEMECRFEVADIPMGQDAAVLIEMGALRMSHRFEPDYDQIEACPDGQGWMFKKFCIFEASVVSIPSNVDAVITAYSREKLHTPMFQRWAKGYADSRAIMVPGVTLPTKDATLTLEPQSDDEPPIPSDDIKKAASVVSSAKSLYSLNTVEFSYEWVSERLSVKAKEKIRPVDNGCEWASVVGTWDAEALVFSMGYRAMTEDRYYMVPWTRKSDTSEPEWDGEPRLVEVSAVIKRLSEDMMFDKGIDKVRSNARTPTYDGTESTSWSKPTLADYVAGMGAPEDTKWTDLKKSQKTKIASHTLIGEASADTFDECNKFPVVNPQTHKLNENAVKNAKARAPQANIPDETKESIQKMCDRLMKMHFMDDERSFNVIERELLAASVKENTEVLCRTAECLRRIVDAREERAVDAALEELLTEL